MMNIDKIVANIQNETEFMALFNKYANEFDLDYKIINKRCNHKMFADSYIIPIGLKKHQSAVFLYVEFYLKNRPKYSGVLSFRDFKRFYEPEAD